MKIRIRGAKEGDGADRILGVGRTVVACVGAAGRLSFMENIVTGNRPVLLVVGKPGHVRDALSGLLSSLAGISQVVCADSGLLALKSVRSLQTAAVLVTASLPDGEIPELILQIKQSWPALPCLLLSEKIEHQREALFAGADRVFPSAIPTSQFLETIEQLLNQP